MDGAGDVFVVDRGNDAVKEVLPNGTIKTIGSWFNQPYGVAVDAAGDVFVGDTNNNAVTPRIKRPAIPTRPCIVSARIPLRDLCDLCG